MMSFFQSIFEFIVAAFHYLINIVENIIQATMVVLALPSTVQSLVGYMPPLISTCATIILSVGIIKLIIGWGNV